MRPAGLSSPMTDWLVWMLIASSSFEISSSSSVIGQVHSLCMVFISGAKGFKDVINLSLLGNCLKTFWSTIVSVPLLIKQNP